MPTRSRPSGAASRFSAERSRSRPVTRPSGAYLSIGGLSRATQVPIETLRTWELRYGFPRPLRKPSGHRQYDIASVARIRRISDALARGLRAGDVVGATESAINSLLATVPPPQPKPARTAPTPQRNGQFTEPGDDPATGGVDAVALLEFIKRFDGDRLMRALQTEALWLDPLAYLESRVAPLVRLVGDAWRRGEIEVRHEHFASERISDVLRVGRLRFEERASGPLVVLATLPGETHGLGLQMAGLVLSSARLRVLSLGTEMPVEELSGLACDMGAVALGLSFSSATRPSARGAVERLRGQLPKRIELLVGGAGAPRDLPGVTRLVSLSDLTTWARGRHLEPSRSESRRRPN